MTKLKKTKDTTVLNHCPICGSRDLMIRNVEVDEGNEDPKDSELTAEIKCQSCSYLFEATANVQEWEYTQPTEIVELQCKIQDLFDHSNFGPSHTANTVEKFIYASALQLLADEALENAHNNLNNAPAVAKEKYIRNRFEDKAEQNNE